MKPGKASLISYETRHSNDFADTNPVVENAETQWQLLSSGKPSWRKCQGHQFGVICCAMIAGTVFLINLILTILAVKKFGLVEGMGIIHTGDCDKAKSTSSWLHVLINVLSTLLLGASNYCMQVVSSPTRKDIDRRHCQNDWMDIGVPGIRNLRRIPWSRRVIWTLLGLSSVPLHLVYNSAVISTLSYQEFSVFAVSESFLTGSKFTFGAPGTDSYFNDVENIYIEGFDKLTIDITNRAKMLQQSISSLKRLENKQCIDTYGATVNSGWGNVLLVSTSSSTMNNSLLGYSRALIDGYDLTIGGGYTAIDNSWLCNITSTDNCDPNTVNPDTWSFGKYPISYCLGQPLQDNCQLEFSLDIMVPVIIFNFVKFFCMLYLVWKLDTSVLVTLGDAVASFLDYPDPTTAGKCLASKAHFLKATDHAPLPIEYRPRRRRWFASASHTRWIASTTLCLVTILVAVSLLGYANNSRNTQAPPLFYAPFGAVDPNNLIQINTTPISPVISMALLANSPQLLLSFLYFTYNGLFTCMLLGDEWNDYAHERKPLRVSAPKGDQRSTYRLSLPYRYGIPLSCIAGVLHFLVSQSIFLARVQAYTDTGDRDPKKDISTCGYSPVAILITAIVSLVVVGVGLGNGFRKYSAGMPLVGSCSAAISAACHPPLGDDQASTKALLWGVVPDNVRREKEENGSAVVHSGEKEHGQVAVSGSVQVGHCTFSSLEVDMPVEGRLYAGLKQKSRLS